MTKETMNDLKRKAEQDVEKIVGQSKTLEKVLKIRRGSVCQCAECMRLQKENQPIITIKSL